MSTTSSLSDYKPYHASTMDIDRAESGSSQLLLKNSISDDLTADDISSCRVPAPNDTPLETPLDLLHRCPQEEPSLKYFASKELVSAYGELFDVYKHVRVDMYTHPNLLRILLSYRNFCEYNRCLDSSCQGLVADILQEIHDSRSDTVHFTTDKIEGEIFLFNLEKVFRVIEPLITYSAALFFASGILLPFTLLWEILLMLFSAVLGFASFSARKYTYKVYDAINKVYKHSYLSSLACLDLAAFFSRSLPGMSRVAVSLKSFQAHIFNLPEYNKEEHEFWLEERLWAATEYNSMSAARRSRYIIDASTTTLTSEVPGNSSSSHSSPTTIGQTSSGIHVQLASTFFRRRHSPVHSY
ncbi:uncharacterized protein EV420DRAFT_1567793 [Desarmillaria tabescens]|uniref:Uncharacterized protein n=1 Tax=Armillaria tabescens TaxID=1929756 RepID=A0AA39MUR7_ARMTA|nr:uncharacterized protein EV420DRAFT_1567793 [Desarmillaria tabescens]KAK0447826.1 hypothetical protein EV420DRAFT_1567793 [Desarmillaria tabescens]